MTMLFLPPSEFNLIVDTDLSLILDGEPDCKELDPDPDTDPDTDTGTDPDTGV
jgi:hypothetical protein